MPKVITPPFVQSTAIAFGAVESDAVNVSAANPFPAALYDANGQSILAGTDYEPVAASQTDQVLGATGATGDLLAGVLIVPATTSPGNVLIQDGAGTAITVFTGGADSVGSLVSFFVPLGIKSTAGAWSLTTGANVSAIGVGEFT